jgi:predicted DNA-binding WGR domain protein
VLNGEGEETMAKKKHEETALVAVEPMAIEVLPPQSGAVGEFLADTANMFRARGMRMKVLFGRINETGQQMEKMLRCAADTMEAAHAKLEEDLRKQCLLPEISCEADDEE